jgi:hypothetical protein
MADNSTVKITIDVIDANSGEVISKVTRNLTGLGTAGKTSGDQVADGAKKSTTALKEVGTAGAEAGQKVAAGMGEVGAHTLTNLDKVRLLRDDLGIRIPRAMEIVISRSGVASAAIGAIGAGLVALGGVEILLRLAGQAYEFYQRLTDVNSEMKKYTENALEASQTKLFDTASLETATQLMRGAESQIDRLNAKRKAADVGEDGSGSLLQYGSKALLGDNFQTYTSDDDKRLAAAHALKDSSEDRLRTLQQTSQMEQLQADGAAKAAALVGSAARKAKLDSDDAIASLKLQQTQANEQALVQRSIEARAAAIRQGKKGTDIPDVRIADPNAGLAEYGDTVARSHAQAAAESTAEARKQSEETLHIQAEARSAGLQGEALYMAQRDEHLRQLKEKMRDTELSPIAYMRQVAAAEQQYAAERQKRLTAEHSETARMQAEAAQGGLRGMARGDAQTNTRVAAIDKEAPGFSDSATTAARESAARQEGQNEQAEQGRAFNDRLAELDSSRADRSQSANDRIDASTKRTQQEILKAWTELYGQLDALDARRVQSYSAVQQELAKIAQDGEKQKQEARQGVLDQTLKAEADGARSGLTREQEQSQAIIDAYTERYRQLEQLRASDKDNADLYRRQEVAAEQEKNGKLLEQQREMQKKQADQLAGIFRGLMEHPLDEIRKQGEAAASKYAANFVVQHTGGAGAAAGGKGGGGFFGLPFGLGSHGAGAQQQAGHQATVASTSSVSAASTTLTAGTATIHVGTATFTGLGTAGSAAMPAAIASAQRSGGSAVSVGIPGVSGGWSGASAQSSGGSPFDVGGAGALGQLPGASASGIPGVAGGWTGSFGGGDASAPMGTAGTLSTAASSVSSGLNNIPGIMQGTSDLGKQLGVGATMPDVSQAAGSSSAALGGAGGGVGGAVGGAAGLFGAAMGNGGFGGALSGLMAGAQFGAAVGGPIGAAIGAAGGAVLGYIGFGGAAKAHAYYNTQVKPRIDADQLQFGMGDMDYQSAYDDLTKLDADAHTASKQWGPGGQREYSDTMQPEIKKAQSQLTREQKAGRSQYGMSAAQMHYGGPVGDFGSMATTGDQGWIHAQQGEFMVQQRAALPHYQALQMMNSGASQSDMASYYGGGTSSRSLPVAPSSSPVNLHFHSHDAKGAYDLLMDNKHTIREALNSSYAENSGGGDLG